MPDQKARTELEVMGSCLELIASLSKPEQERVLKWLSDKLNVARPEQPTSPSASFGQAGVAVPIANLSPKAFLAQKKPTTNAERVTCLAFYLTYNRGTALFKTADITKLNIEAAQTPFTNPTVAVNDATKLNHYLAAAGGGKKQITVRGEALVNSLPDRARVTAALAEHPVSRRVRKSARDSDKADRA
jgi:hypothetical protein